MNATFRKPVILYKEDARSTIAGRDNPLVVGPADFRSVDDLERLPEALAERIAAAGLSAETEISCSRHLMQTVIAGERLWQSLDTLGPVRNVEPVAEVVLELFASPAAAGASASAYQLDGQRT